MLPNEEHLNFICEMISQSFQVSVLLLGANGRIQGEFGNPPVTSLLNLEKQELVNQLFYKNDSSLFPYIRTTSYLECFICLTLKDEKELKGAILVGPILDSRFSKEMLHGLMEDLEIPISKMEETIAYYQSLPVLSKLKIIFLGIQVYYLIYRKILDPVSVGQMNKSIESKFVEIKSVNSDLSERRKNQTLHHDLMYERQVLSYVAEGKKEEVLKFWRNAGAAGEFGLLSKKSHLRNMKNLAITLITLVTRAAMEGGMYQELAYTLSDRYIQNLEELKTIEEVNALIEEALTDFTDHVQKSRKLNYSKPINSALSYIFNNIYEDINFEELSQEAGVHRNYLSALFKKEMGITLKHYILEQKIEEAKSLLKFTDSSLLEIATLLNFHDQSYFTKVFKKFTGFTPHQYRNTTN
jgi:YSIRK-targeted surface antigen transcriptional regulator